MCGCSVCAHVLCATFPHSCVQHPLPAWNSGFCCQPPSPAQHLFPDDEAKGISAPGVKSREETLQTDLHTTPCPLCGHNTRVQPLPVSLHPAGWRVRKLLGRGLRRWPPLHQSQHAHCWGQPARWPPRGKDLVTEAISQEKNPRIPPTAVWELVRGQRGQM